MAANSSSSAHWSTDWSTDEQLLAPRLVQNLTVLNCANRDAVALATVCVKIRMGQGEEACASGVSIDPQLIEIDPIKGAVVLTNYEVIIDMGNRPPLQLAGKGEVYNAEIIRQSPEFDSKMSFILILSSVFFYC